jgi:hypothetical protein
MSAIKAGDLVMMVRGHECAMESVGYIPFVVTGFASPWGGGWECPKCGQRSAGPNEVAAIGWFSKRIRIPISWLRKIEPPAIPETTERETEVTV